SRVGAGRPEHLHGAGRDPAAVPQLPARAALRAMPACPPPASELRRGQRRRLPRAHARGARRPGAGADARAGPLPRRRVGRSGARCPAYRPGARKSLVGPALKKELEMFAVLYGVIVYGLFLGTITYLIGFTGNLGVPKSIDGGTAGPLAEAVIV